jgi:hypothetical protein
MSEIDWKKFGLFSCGTNRGVPFLNFEILWDPVLRARLASHSWLDDTDWKGFIETAQIGDVFDGKGIIIIVRLREQPTDFESE